jgi:hypothetical protein
LAEKGLGNVAVELPAKFVVFSILKRYGMVHVFTAQARSRREVFGKVDAQYRA